MTPPSYTCSSCGFELWIPLRRLSTSVLGLYDDARYPGRCLLVLDPHYEDLTSVPAPVLAAFMDDVQNSGRAIAAATGADRVNYAVLGNAVPHVHFHLIPRIRATDPVPSQSPWETPLPHAALPPHALEAVASRLSARLDAIA